MSLLGERRIRCNTSQLNIDAAPFANLQTILNSLGNIREKTTHFLGGLKILLFAVRPLFLESSSTRPWWMQTLASWASNSSRSRKRTSFVATTGFFLVPILLLRHCTLFHTPDSSFDLNIKGVWKIEDQKASAQLPLPNFQPRGLYQYLPLSRLTKQ